MIYIAPLILIAMIAFCIGYKLSINRTSVWVVSLQDKEIAFMHGLKWLIWVILIYCLLLFFLIPTYHHILKP